MKKMPNILTEMLTPLKISISFPKDLVLHECYIYAGYLFLIFDDGSFRVTPLKSILQKIFEGDKDRSRYNFYQIAFLRNDWYSSEFFKTLNSVSIMEGAFIESWIAYSNPISLELSMSDLKTLGSMPKMPIFDLRLFGLHAFVGNRDGLYESVVGFSSSIEKIKLNGDFEKRFDARSTYLSTKSGTLLVSSNTDGLFYGNLGATNEKMKIIEKPIREKSIRAGWSDFDVVNYTSNDSFDYLCSVREKNKKDDSTPSAAVNRSEDGTPRSKIVSIGEVGAYDMEHIFTQKSSLRENLSFVFNSSKNCILFYQDGTVKSVEFKKHLKENVPNNNKWVHLAENKTKIPKVNSTPLSVNFVHNKACVAEFINGVSLIQNGHIFELENETVISIKTYLNAIRFKNIISVVNDDGLNLYSVFPLEFLRN